MYSSKNISLAIISLFFLTGFSILNAQFVHPGISHKESDLDRMKAMVEAQIDPWYASYQNMIADSKSSYDYDVRGDTSFKEIGRDNGKNYGAWNSDIRAAYYNAIQWYVTGDERHAEKAVEIFNAWTGVEAVTSNGTRSLSGGTGYIMIEAAEIIKSTYSGWNNSDIQAFKDMLVYPGYSNTQEPSGISNSFGSFYWQAYQGDAGRHGNQGLSGWRTVMAMGIFLDNERMYDRALRYVQGLPHRSDDIPYASGPNTSNSIIGSNEYADTYSISKGSSTEDYGFNDVLVHYIYEGGQCQESSRDQAHVTFGLGLLNSMAEMAWSQGDDLYSHANDRLFDGIEYSMRYNVSEIASFSDQTSPWEPSTFLTGFERTGRWYSKAISPVARGVFTDDRPYWERSVAHYIGRGFKTAQQAKWTLRARDVSIDEVGYERQGHSNDAIGWGGLTFRRPNLCYGDPISGFTSSGLPEYQMHQLPGTIEAENFDHFQVNGNGKTYNDLDSQNIGKEYRLDQGVDIQVCSEGGYNVGWMRPNEWLTYTVNVPENGTYNISIRYAATNSNGKIKFQFDGDDKTGEVTVPSTGGWQNWESLMVGEEVQLSKGVQNLKILVAGSASGYNLNHFTITTVSTSITSPPLVHMKKRNATGFAIDGNGGGDNGQNVYLWTSNTNNENQLWYEIDRGNGYYSYQKFGTDFCLDGDQGGENGQNVYLWECKDTNQNQHWQKVSVGSGAYKLIKRNASGFALDGGSGGKEGQNIALYNSSSSSQNLQWVFTNVKSSEIELEEKEETLVGLYPVPVTDVLNITLSKDIQYGKVEIIDASGSIKFVQSLTNRSESLDMSSLAQGFYIIKITGANMVYRKSIIKQ